MCTAISISNGDHYFGRTLDLEYSLNESIVITPRYFPFNFKHEKTIEDHYAIIGTAIICDNYPLYYDAINEVGLGMAGLKFTPPTNHFEPKAELHNIETFELIPWVLSTCENVEQARTKIDQTCILSNNFNEQFSAAPLHWIISDKTTSITIEMSSDGIKIYDNPIGVLTNDPSFEYQMTNLNNYINLTAYPPQNRFYKNVKLTAYSKGMGAIGLPGDVSSVSRFVRVAFTKLNSICEQNGQENISQFFHILDTVAQVRGCVRLEDEKYEITVYTSCYNADKGICYYTTYNNRQISAVDMHKENLNSDMLLSYKMNKEQFVFQQN